MAVKYQCPNCERRFVDWGAEKLGYKCPECGDSDLLRVGAPDEIGKAAPSLKRKKAAKAALAKKSAAKKAAAKKSTAKKSTAKKSTAKKSTAKKSTAKKSTAKDANDVIVGDDDNTDGTDTPIETAADDNALA